LIICEGYVELAGRILERDDARGAGSAIGAHVHCLGLLRPSSIAGRLDTLSAPLEIAAKGIFPFLQVVGGRNDLQAPVAWAVRPGAPTVNKPVALCDIFLYGKLTEFFRYHKQRLKRVAVCDNCVWPNHGSPEQQDNPQQHYKDTANDQSNPGYSHPNFHVHASTEPQLFRRTAPALMINDLRIFV